MTHRDPSYTRESERPVGPGRAAWERGVTAPRPECPAVDSAEDALTWLRIGEADERVLAVLSILEDELYAARSQAARAQRLLDEERRR